MKKAIFSAIVMAFVFISCNKKNEENTTHHSHDMEEKGAMMNNDSTMMNDKTKTMHDHAAMYACPMHPEVQGKMNDKCSKCGMNLTEPVSEKTDESK